jgi:nicotinamide-nucleotide amidase
MVCFGFYVNGTTYSITKYFGDLGRNVVRNLSVSFAIEFLNSIL